MYLSKLQFQGFKKLKRGMYRFRVDGMHSVYGFDKGGAVTALVVFAKRDLYIAGKRSVNSDFLIISGLTQTELVVE